MGQLRIQGLWGGVNGWSNLMVNTLRFVESDSKKEVIGCRYWQEVYVNRNPKECITSSQTKSMKVLV